MVGKNEALTKCVESETFPYSFPPFNGITRALMELTDVAQPGSEHCPGQLYHITVEYKDYTVCETEPGKMITISGNDMVLTVLFADNVGVMTHRGISTGCTRMAFPAHVTPIGKSLLSGESRSLASY